MRRAPLSSMMDKTLQQFAVAGKLVHHLLQKAMVDLVDDLQVPRQQALEHRHRPGLQRFRHQRVVGIGKNARGQSPRIVPSQFMHIHQQTHHLGDGNGRMCVIQLHRQFVRQLRPAFMVLFEAEQHVLQRGADKEILLLQTQPAAHLGGIVRVKHLGQGSPTRSCRPQPGYSYPG
jgi:hypothetical protein